MSRCTSPVRRCRAECVWPCFENLQYSRDCIHLERAVLPLRPDDPVTNRRRTAVRRAGNKQLQQAIPVVRADDGAVDRGLADVADIALIYRTEGVQNDWVQRKDRESVMNISNCKMI